MFSGRHPILRDDSGHPFVDADPVCFGHILNYLRTEVVPPEEAAVDVYRMASYFAIEPLRERLLLVPAVAKTAVLELFSSRFDRYNETKQRVIKEAIKKAAADANCVGCINVLVVRRKSNPAVLDIHPHECVYKTADLQQGDGNVATAAYDQTFVDCIEWDLKEAGFDVNTTLTGCSYRCPYGVRNISIKF